MVRHNWKYVMNTPNSSIYVDYNSYKTKIIGIKFIYYYDGIYPNIDYNTRKRYDK